MARASRRPSLLPCDPEIWETSLSTTQPVRAVKAVLDSRRPRLKLDASIPLGPSLAVDVQKVIEMLHPDTPCVMLIRLTDDTHTLAAKETDRLVLLWLPTSTPEGVHSNWKSGSASLAAKVLDARVAEMEANDEDDFSLEDVLANCKDMIDNAGSEAAPKRHAGKQTVETIDAVLLPCYRLNSPLGPPAGLNASPEGAGDAPLFVFGHGLTCRLADYCETNLGPAGDVDLLAAAESFAGKLVQPSIVLYDARGHGESTGWERRGPHQFHWRALANDMLQVAAAHRAPTDPPFILGGCSMGAGTALWAALLNPNSIRGIVLYQAPTMWETRRARRGNLEERAEGLRADDPVQADVLLGAARCDMPSKEDLEPLAAMQLPVLIVNCRDDPVHPASSAEWLRDALGPRVTMVVIDQRAHLAKAFTDALGKWVVTLGGPERASLRPSIRGSVRPRTSVRA